MRSTKKKKNNAIELNIKTHGHQQELNEGFQNCNTVSSQYKAHNFIIRKKGVLQFMERYFS